MYKGSCRDKWKQFITRGIKQVKQFNNYHPLCICETENGILTKMELSAHATFDFTITYWHMSLYHVLSKKSDQFTVVVVFSLTNFFARTPKPEKLHLDLIGIMVLMRCVTYSLWPSSHCFNCFFTAL